MKGSIVAIVTPMHENGEINFNDLEKIINWHVNNGTNGIVAVGTTGESPSLNFKEHIDVIKNWLSDLQNITAIGRSGMFKYNNQDHAMATGLYAARTLLGHGEFDPWEVNVDGEYHEEVTNN